MKIKLDICPRRRYIIDKELKVAGAGAQHSLTKFNLKEVIMGKEKAFEEKKRIIKDLDLKELTSWYVELLEIKRGVIEELNFMHTCMKHLIIE